MQYFSKITQNYWTSKNKAHEQILGVIITYDQILIEKDKLKDFEIDLFTDIAEVNLNNPRCKDLEISIFPDYLDKDEVFFEIPGVFLMHLYKVCDYY
ncbi:MAG: hypothetical protein K8S00_09850 [Bacteroidales bacterium]|nr:hypothetical protein [Bacteroidales bacterium]